MCDSISRSMDSAENNQGANQTTLIRRDTSNITLPSPEGALKISARDLDIQTPDGLADGYFVRPNQGQYPAVLIWTDILGMRRSFRLMANRLAESGYAVLVVNPYYRVARGAVVEEGADFTQPGIPEIVIPYATTLSPDTCLRDGRVFIEFLQTQKAVDSSRKMAVTGYCMTGDYPLRMAVDMPDKIGACASFHANQLHTHNALSPHIVVEKIQAESLIVIAENDDKNAPEIKGLMAEAFEKAQVNAEVSVYPETIHGFCPPDSAVHNVEKAELAWARQLALFRRVL